MKSPGRTLALSFATTVAMWAVAYVAMMKPGLVVGEVLFGLLLLCPVLGGLVATRSGGESASPFEAAKVGLGVATLNLLIIGSLLVDPQTHKLHEKAVAWIAGNFIASVGLAALGGFVGLYFRDKARQDQNWFNVFAKVAAATVFLLLITGGIVTGREAGMAVPDWPNSFGHNMLLYPLSEMRGGIYYEHAHRLYGMLVGVTAIALAVGSFVFDQRGWLRTLAIIYLIMVCAQGVMGGTRVTELSRTLAIAHGVFGQIVFATVVAIAAFTSTTWRQFDDKALQDSPGNSTDRKLAIALPLLLIVQLALGALYRHLRREWNTPPEPLHPLYTHMVVALLVTILTIIVGGRAWAGSGGYRGKPVVATIGQILIALVGGQLILGIASTIAVWSRTVEQHIPILEVIITTAHQATGALLLATATLLMVWTLRFLRAKSKLGGGIKRSKSKLRAVRAK